jgi:hypothetical protein
MVVGLFCRIAFGREVFWSRAFGHECLVARHLVACHLVIGSFDRVVIWSRGLMVVRSFGCMSFGRMVIWSLVVSIEFSSFCIKLEIREPSFSIYRRSWRMESTSFCVQFGKT